MPSIPPGGTMTWPALRVRILGPLDVEGMATSDLGSRKQRLLLRVLAAGRGAAVGVDHIIDCLWPQSPPTQPSDQVGVLVSRLRSVLGSHRIVRSDAGYSLAADWIDLVALEQLTGEAERRLREGQPTLAATAAGAGLALLRGPALADDFDAPWADSVRGWTDRMVARLRLTAAAAALAAGDPLEAAVTAAEALDQDPYDEHALRLLMTAHSRAGRPASALSAYAQTRDRLAEDLGASPAAPTEALHTSIVRDELAAWPSGPGPSESPTAAPDTRTPTPGRADSWAALDRAYARARTQVVLAVIEGEAGIGKTRLAKDWTASLGAPVFWGTCDPLGNALSLGPLLDALHHHLAHITAVERLRLTQAAGPVLAPLLRAEQAVSATAVEPSSAQAAMFAGILEVCCHTSAGRQGLTAVLVIDDAHLADDATLAWLAFAARRPETGPLLIVVARRPEGPPLPATVIELGPLDAAATAALFGEERAIDLHARSGGHPLFLVELARSDADSLPSSILDSVDSRCERLGSAASTLRAAAVLGPVVDLDLLASVLSTPAVTLLGHLEEGERHRLLAEQGAAFIFRHELVREALVAGTGAARRRLLHREAARLLFARERHDPILVAFHARQAGEKDLAARALVEAASISSERFDYGEAEHLLDEALALEVSPSALLARARVRLTRDRLPQALGDAEAALELGAGVAALELAGWVAYYQRDFAAARSFVERALPEKEPQNFQLTAGIADEAGSVGALALAGRIDHADGDLDRAQSRLESAVALASLADGRGAPGGSPSPQGDGHGWAAAGMAAVWLGWLRVDRGELDGDAPPATATHGSSAGHPFGLAHRALRDAHAAGLAGLVQRALAGLDQVDTEVDRRGLEHFAGRTMNYRAWLLRNICDFDEADDLNAAAAEKAALHNLREAQAQSALDLADGHLRRGDLDSAAGALDRADRQGRGYAFAWRAQLRHRLLSARLELAAGNAAGAVELARQVEDEAKRLRLPRYITLAGLAGVLARADSGDMVTAGFDAAERLLGDLDRFAGPESWWITAELARVYRMDRWWSMAEARAATLAANAGPRADQFRRHAGAWLDRTRTSRRSG